MIKYRRNIKIILLLLALVEEGGADVYYLRVSQYRASMFALASYIARVLYFVSGVARGEIIFGKRGIGFTEAVAGDCAAI